MASGKRAGRGQALWRDEAARPEVLIRQAGLAPECSQIYRTQ